MLAGIRKRLARKRSGSQDSTEDDLSTYTPRTNYIRIAQGEIQLVQSRSLEESRANDVISSKDKEILEDRVSQLEDAILNLQDKVNNSPCNSPTFENDLRQQMGSMTRFMKTTERKQTQTYRDNKALQARFARHDAVLQSMQLENKALIKRLHQYQHYIEDVMRKVVVAILAEDNLREDVTSLKNRIHDLETQNATLSASLTRGRDEGYNTMSSGLPQLSNGNLEDLPEEPEEWYLPPEPCPMDMEDWDMSQDQQLPPKTIQEEQMQSQYCGQEENADDLEWLENSNYFIKSTESDALTESITQLLEEKIVYSDDEELACTEFTNDFYKLVNIRPSSQHSLYSYLEGETDGDDDYNEENSPICSEDIVGSRDRSLAKNMQRLIPGHHDIGCAQMASWSSSCESNDDTTTGSSSTGQDENLANG